MSSKPTELPAKTPETLLKTLAVVLSENNKDVANKAYEVMRDMLLDRQNGGKNVNQKLVNLDKHSRVAVEFESYLCDRRLVKQYLETVNPNTAFKFSSLADSVQNERDLLSLESVWPLKFLMAMARKKNSEDTIIESRLKIQPRIKPSKGKAPLPPELDSPDKSTPSTSSSTSKFRATTSSSQTNGSYKKLPESRPQESVLKCSRVNDLNVNLDVGGDLSEWDIIEGLLFVWQGIQSKIFRRCERTQNYFLHEKWHVYPWVREQADNLASLGYLHDTLLPFGKTPLNEGLIRKCLAGFVREKLSDYYALVASVRTEFQRQAAVDDGDAAGGLTLEQLRLQSSAVARELMDLISIVEMTKTDKGGCLASGVFCFIRHGGPNLQNLVKDILAQICQPLYGMLTKWLLEGIVYDKSEEFFIAATNHVEGDRLWQEKYSIRMSMLPEFIPVELAEQVLSVGRSINFLRERCDNELPFAEREKMKTLFTSRTAEVMYSTKQGSELEGLVMLAYEETNKRVLDVLLTKYALLDHFHAHRKFLLLGQGEFIHHLMDLLMDVLEKPANELHPHILNSVLESAVRATTAQFESDDIINRLDAATLIPADSETGWEVFYLRYHVDGPIGTVFSQSCRNEYQKLFCALWKAKRIEMILSKSWKHQITSAKILRRIGELGPTLRQCHELTAEMLHFVRQTQYYFLFEVLECAWNQLIENVHLAANLDAVIEAHTEFLDKVTAGVFMDEARQNLALKLRVVYDMVLSLVSQVDALLQAGETEMRQRGLAGTHLVGTEAGEGSKVDYLRKRRDFVSRFLPNAAGGLRILAQTYRSTIKKFLLTLNSEDDLNLQLLSVRLDFNSHYKQLDSRLEAPLTFQHRRMSSLGGELSPILTRKFSMEKR